MSMVHGTTKGYTDDQDLGTQNHDNPSDLCCYQGPWYHLGQDCY